MIVEKKINHDDTEVQFVYISNPIQKLCSEEQYRALKVFNDRKIIDIEEVVKTLRVIFAGEKEDGISVTVKYGHDISQAFYKDNQLICYKNCVALDHHCQNSDMLEFEYHIDNGIKISATNNYSDINDKRIVREMHRFASTELSYLDKLKNINIDGNKNQKTEQKKLNKTL